MFSIFRNQQKFFDGILYLCREDQIFLQRGVKCIFMYIFTKTNKFVVNWSLEVSFFIIYFILEEIKVCCGEK